MVAMVMRSSTAELGRVEGDGFGRYSGVDVSFAGRNSSLGPKVRAAKDAIRRWRGACVRGLGGGDGAKAPLRQRALFRASGLQAFAGAAVP